MIVQEKLEVSDLRPNYRGFAMGAGKPVLAAFADLPSVYPAMRAISLAGLPAAFAMIERVEIECARSIQKFSGSVASRSSSGSAHCGRWRCMAFSERHQAVDPHPSFSRGEVYEINDYAPIPLASAGTGNATGRDELVGAES